MAARLPHPGLCNSLPHCNRTPYRQASPRFGSCGPFVARTCSSAFRPAGNEMQAWSFPKKACPPERPLTTAPRWQEKAVSVLHAALITENTILVIAPGSQL